MKKLQITLGSFLLIAIFTIGSAFSLSPNTHGPAPVPKVTTCWFYEYQGAFEIGVTTPSDPLGTSTNYLKLTSVIPPCDGGAWFCGVLVCTETGPELNITVIAPKVKTKYDNTPSPKATNFSHGLSWQETINGHVYTFTVYRRSTSEPQS